VILSIIRPMNPHFALISRALACVAARPFSIEA
jgi:hypothetical protein